MAEQQQLQPGQTEEPAETGFFDRLFSGDKPLWIIVISLAIISLLVVLVAIAVEYALGIAPGGVIG